MNTRNQLAIVSIATSAIAAVGAFWIHAGLWPVHISPREPGFDKLENMIRLAPVLLVSWGTLAFAHPKSAALILAICATVIYAVAFFAIG